MGTVVGKGRARTNPLVRRKAERRADARHQTFADRALKDARSRLRVQNKNRDSDRAWLNRTAHRVCSTFKHGRPGLEITKAGKPKPKVIQIKVD